MTWVLLNIWLTSRYQFDMGSTRWAKVLARLLSHAMAYTTQKEQSYTVLKYKLRRCVRPKLSRSVVKTFLCIAYSSNEAVTNGSKLFEKNGKMLSHSFLSKCSKGNVLALLCTCKGSTLRRLRCSWRALLHHCLIMVTLNDILSFQCLILDLNNYTLIHLLRNMERVAIS